MIYSMTGYGTAKGKIEDLDVTIELKSVNNRYLDTSVRVPRGFVFLSVQVPLNHLFITIIVGIWNPAAAAIQCPYSWSIPMMIISTLTPTT